jgi:microcin C transport system substrate-binding protein
MTKTQRDFMKATALTFIINIVLGIAPLSHAKERPPERSQALAPPPPPAPPPASPKKADGFSIFDHRNYPDGFHNFDYVNPAAPKGGKLTLSAIGTFNSLNPFIVRGDPPAGLGLTLSALMTETTDRAGESYAFVAEKIEVADDRRFVIFHINPKAQFDDGVKITADTIIWSFNTLKEKGNPMFRTYYKNVTKVEKLDLYRVKFHLDGTKNAELPFILGQIYALPQHFYEKVDFASTSLEIPPSSGPYKIKSIDPGRRLVYERVKNWWGADLPSQVGKNNFDEIQYEFFLDPSAQLEAFKSGRIDIRAETSIKNWMTAYQFPAVQNGWVIREELPHTATEPTYGFFFNTRRPVFKDRRIREALTLLYDFGWVNKHLFYGAYQRNLSYFSNSCFAAQGLPSPEELEILTPLKDQVSPRLFTEKLDLPHPQNPQEVRQILQQAIRLFEEAGWHIKDGWMVHKETGDPFQFEILIDDQSKEKLCMNYGSTLERIGIKVTVRSIDKAAYTQRVETKNFDMILDSILQSNSLGNEQRDFFGSSRADTPGSRNFSGVKDPVIDEVIEKLIQSHSYQHLCHRARALDRLLFWGFYMIPAWHRGRLMVAYWDKFGHPQNAPQFTPFNIQTWWYDSHKAKRLTEKMETSSASIASTISTVVTKLWNRVKGWVQ